MIYSNDCLKKYGDPRLKANQLKWLEVWDVPAELEIGYIPKKLYCNKDLIAPLSKAFRNLIDRDFVKELKTWDGCWNVRAIRGYEYSKPIKWSLHSWGVAIDLNASENGLGKKPKLSAGFVRCFTDAGFDWGGRFSRPDGMHFQLSKLP